MADIKSFMVCEDSSTIEQINHMGDNPACVDSKIRVMPDGHAGKGCVVGSTITYTDKIVPFYVGVDVACTVSLWLIDRELIDFEKIDQLVHENVPHGTDVRNKEHEYSVNFPYDDLYCWEHLDGHDRLRLSMGSLDSGNHMIAVDYDQTTDQYFLCVHCGSRSLGLKMAEFYQNIAIDKRNGRVNSIQRVADKFLEVARGRGDVQEVHKILETRNRMISYEPADDECYLDDREMFEYLHDCDIIKNWVELNHRIIAESILGQLGQKVIEPYLINTHNYVDTKDKIIRKGAIRAHKNDLCAIPLNMRDGVLVVRAKGNDDWNYSLPHGAGRILSRGQARRELTLEDFKEDMKNVYSTCVMTETLDESPRAYKPAELIMEAIQDNGVIIAHLQEVYNFKAH